MCWRVSCCWGLIGLRKLSLIRSSAIGICSSGFSRRLLIFWLLIPSFRISFSRLRFLEWLLGIIVGW